MAARPSWEGHLRLSLVTCPVALWPATTEAETIRFNLINPKTNNRIRMQTLDAGTGEEVSRAATSARAPAFFLTPLRKRISLQSLV